MTNDQTAALVAFLMEQRRHLLAQARACEVLLASINAQEKSCYNSSIKTPQVEGPGVTITGVNDRV